MPIKPRRARRGYIRLTIRGAAWRCNEYDIGKATMHMRLQRLLRGAAFVLATLGATGALVAAGLNDEGASTSASVAR